MKQNTVFNRVTPRVAIYVRLSDEDKNKGDKDEKSESIKNQIALATKYSNEKNWHIYDIYIDDDWSGLDRDRPEFNRLLRDCEKGNIDIVLCKDMSRFSRDKIITEEYLETKFIEWGVRFIGLSDGVDTADKANKKSREINALVNQWYAEDISMKVRDALKIKRETGNFIGSFPPYGYKKSPHNKNKLEIDEVAANIVRLIFQLYLEGYGTTSIANILNDRKIPNPCTYKELTLNNYKNPLKKNSQSLWSKTSVKRILRNEVYIGVLQQHKNEKVHFKTKRRKQIPPEQWTVIENNHPPIIEKSIFFTVQKMMNARIRGSGHGKIHLLAGKVFCKDCKSSLIKSSSGKYTYLSCGLYLSSHASCTRHSIRLDLLLKLIEDRLKQQLLKLNVKKEKVIQDLFEKIKISNEKQNYQTLRASILFKINELNKAIKQLYIDKANKKIDETTWKDILSQLLQEKGYLDQELSRLRDKQECIVLTKEELEKEFNDLLFLNQFNRALLNSLIDYIEVGEVKDNTQEIIIHYTFYNQ